MSQQRKREQPQKVAVLPKITKIFKSNTDETLNRNDLLQSNLKERCEKTRESIIDNEQCNDGALLSELENLRQKVSFLAKKIESYQENEKLYIALLKKERLKNLAKTKKLINLKHNKSDSVLFEEFRGKNSDTHLRELNPIKENLLF